MSVLVGEKIIVARDGGEARVVARETRGSLVAPYISAVVCRCLLYVPLTCK